MDVMIREAIRKLPASPTALSEKNIKKIRKKIPVPNDFTIIWASVERFGVDPKGIVITEEALIVKGGTEDCRQKKESEGLKNRLKREKPVAPYYIIPWELYTPDLIKFDKDYGEKNAEGYVFISSGEPVAHFDVPELYDAFKGIELAERAFRAAADDLVEQSSFGAFGTYGVEPVMFNAAYGADQTKTGHGIYAEEGGALLDRLNGERSTVVGRDNAKNGPDKIVNAKPVQCKYYADASHSISACFETNPSTGAREFRYLDLNGRPMKIEVPLDQYADALKSMERHIERGEVPGVTNPKDAVKIVRQGRYTYQQVKNLARAGNIDSLTFDLATGAITLLPGIGITSAIAFAQAMWRGEDARDAALEALGAGVKVYGISVLGSVAASQIARTGVANVFSGAAETIGKKLGPKATQGFVNSMRALAGKRAIYGSEAQKSFAKFMGSNVIVEGVMFVAFSIPDTYRLARGRVSGAQYALNLTTQFASVLGTVGGSAAAGAALGKFGGEKISKNVGAAVGMAGGLIGGTAAGIAVSTVGKKFREDDGAVALRMFNAVVANCAMENLLNESETEELIEVLDQDEEAIKKLLQGLMRSNNQSQRIGKYLNEKIEAVTKKRKRISKRDERKIVEEASRILEEVTEDDEV